MCCDSPAGTQYTRPYSRVHLAAKLEILLVPTLAVYHVPTKRWIDKAVGQAPMREDRWGDTYEKWERAESVGFGVVGERRLRMSADKVG